MHFKQQNKLQNKKVSHRHFDRISFLALIIFLIGAGIITRLFFLQIIHHRTYQILATRTHGLNQNIESKRGEIFVHDQEASDQIHSIAYNRDLYLIYAIPSVIENPEELAKKLSPVLNMTEEELLPRLAKKGDPYEPLKNSLEESQVKTIKEMNLKGIDFAAESARFYPDKNLFSHILGFVGFKNNEKIGRYGLEEEFENELKGKTGKIIAEKDAFGGLIPVSDFRIQDSEDGANLLLTLVYPIQYTACTELKAGVQQHGADSGSVIVINPKTGAILALCNYPDFDPNAYGQEKNSKIFINSAVSSLYEPGSIFKPITMSSALDTGKITAETTYEDTGAVKIGSYTIKNSDLKAHGLMTMTDVLEKSLNTGAIFAMRKTGKNVFAEYVEKFGFGKLTGIELPNEQAGNVGSIDKANDIYAITASFGQGINVTPLQIAAAYSTIANNGKMMQPYLIDEINYANGKIKKTEAKVLSQVISAETASTLSAMMVAVVEKGSGKRAAVPGFYIAGKSGTAQVSNINKRGYSEQIYIHSFCGFGPVDSPRFMMLVKIDNPKDVQFAEGSAVPVFGKIAKFILDYYKVLPER